MVSDLIFFWLELLRVLNCMWDFGFSDCLNGSQFFFKGEKEVHFHGGGRFLMFLEV